MKLWKLSDFLVPYPNYDEENFQTLISAKKEFNELASQANEPTPQQGEWYNHQLFTQRYLRAYDRLLIISETGTGKTGQIAAITEYLKHEHLKAIETFNSFDVKNAHYKRAIILSSASVAKEFEYQLICKYTEDDYAINTVRLQLEKSSSAKPKKLIRNALRKWYKFDTEEKFSKMIKKEYQSDLKLHADYDNSIIVMDEVHNLFVRNKEKEKQDAWSAKDTYDSLFNFLHRAENIMIIQASATPMLNYVYEIGQILNLQLPLEMQLPVGSDSEKYYKTVTLNDLEPILRGRISFVRAFAADAERVDQINPKMSTCEHCPDYLTLYLTKMSEFQSSAYKQTMKNVGGISYSLYLTYISNFAYPDFNDSVIANYLELRPKSLEDKKTGYYKYVIAQHIKGKSRIIYKLNEKAQPSLNIDSIKNVRRYSCKYAAILESIEKAGITFIYQEHIKASGSIILSLCLEHALRFEPFWETTSVFESKEEKTDDFCDTKVGTRTIRENFKKKRRYVLLTKDLVNNDVVFNNMMELVRSYENRHGEYLQCIIASSVAKEGLSFKNVTDIHLAEPEHSPGTIYQAISRGIRSGSHDDLIKESPDGKVEIKVYLHAAIPDPKIYKKQASDVHIFDIAYQKKEDIENMMIKLKQVSVDCQVHYNRNIRETDVNTYICVDPPYSTVDYSTYNAYYIEDDVKKYIETIKKSLSGLPALFTIKDVVNSTDLDVVVVEIALEELILSRVIVLDAFGLPAYVTKNGNHYALTRSIPILEINNILTSDNRKLVVNRYEAGGFLKSYEVSQYKTFLKSEGDVEDFEKLSKDNQIKFIEDYWDKDQFVEITKNYNNMFYKFKKDIVNMLNLFRLEPRNRVQYYLNAKIDLRIKNPTDLEWRDATTEENEIYRKQISKQNTDRFIHMVKQFDYLFGINIGGDILVAYEKNEEKMEKVLKNGVGRDTARGKECRSFTKDIKEIAEKVGLREKDLKVKDKWISNEVICQKIIKRLKRDDRIM